MKTLTKLCGAALLLCALSQVALATQIYDRLKGATVGQFPSGTITISWPTFQNAAGKSIPAGETTVQVNSGVVNVSLEPYAGYSVTYTLGKTYKASMETWTVPDSVVPLSVAQVRSSPLQPSGPTIGLPSIEQGGALDGQCLTWVAASTSWLPVTCAAGGGGTGNATQLQGRAIDPTGPLNGQVLVWNTSLARWVPGALGAGPGINITNNSTVNNTDKGTDARAAHESANDHSKLGTLANVTGDVQAQIDAKQAVLGYTAEDTAKRNQPNGYVGKDANGNVTIGNTVVDAVRGVTPLFDWCVDSVNGSDTVNDGKCDANGPRPYQTIAKLLTQTITAGQTIGLAYGSMWREALAAPADNVTIAGYGSGTRPLLDATDIITGWSKTGGLGAVYQASMTVNAGASQAVRVFANGMQLTKTASTAACDAAAGSYYASATTGAITIYVHAAADANPASDGKLYELSSRPYGVDSFVSNRSGVKFANLRTRGSVAFNGCLQLGINSTATNVDALDCGVENHFILVSRDSTLSNVRAIGNSFVAQIVHYDGTAGTHSATFNNVVAWDTGSNALHPGFFSHADGGALFNVVYNNCRTNGDIEGSSIATATVTGGSNAGIALNGPTVNISGTAMTGMLTTFAAQTITADAITMNYTGTYAISLDGAGTTNLRLTNSTITASSRGIWIWGGGTLYSHNNNWHAGYGIYWSTGATVAIDSDYNTWNGGVARWNNLDKDLAAWRTATGQDAHSN